MIYEDEKALACRKEFPGLAQTLYDHRLIYLDNAATNQVGTAVIDAMTAHMIKENANTHRGVHYLSEQATMHFEQTRSDVAGFIGAQDSDCVAFNAGTTAGINTIALGLESRIKSGDAVLVTQLEHHSNYLPWQQLCCRTGAEFRVVPLTGQGDIDLEAYRRLLADGHVKVAAIAHTSNVTGSVNPVKQMVAEAHERDAVCVIDGAQGVRNGRIDVVDIDCDFFCFSAHKMIGPTGVGAIYGKKEALQKLAVKSFGGGMVDRVGYLSSEFSDIPFCLEPGTPNIVGVAGFRAAIAALNRIGREWIAKRERELTRYLENGLRSIEQVTVLGSPQIRSGVVSFVVKGRHPYDLASIMDKHGVAVRVGHHCAIPCLAHFGEDTALRMSPAFYNLFKEIDEALSALQKAIAFFSRWDA